MNPERFNPPFNQELSPDITGEAYFQYLESTTGINRAHPNVVEALERLPEKVVAHVLLAYAGITEQESHLMPLTDLNSIIAHAKYYYETNQNPWFDFATTLDYSVKNNPDSPHKDSAPLFRDCATFEDFLIKVVPEIGRLRKDDPNAYIKIFPQSKNVETFNLGIITHTDRSVTWTIEWHPGAYTPRSGEEGELVVDKNKATDKEERIVRATIEFDSLGHPTVFLKPLIDNSDPDQSIVKPLAFPENGIDWQGQMFRQATILENHDTMISSNDPFVLLAYLTNNPQFAELLGKFEKVHKQLGYANLVLSGMIGPNTVFGIDINIDTPPNYETESTYIRDEIDQIDKPHLHSVLAYHRIEQAEIYDERDKFIVDELTYFYRWFSDFFQVVETTGCIWPEGYFTIMSLLTSEFLPKLATPWLEIIDWVPLTSKQKSILASIGRSLDTWQVRQSTLEQHEKFSARPGLVRPAIPFQTPKQNDALQTHALRIHKPVVVNRKHVADLV